MGSQNKTTYRNWEPCSNTSGQLGTDLLTTILGRLTLNHLHTDALERKTAAAVEETRTIPSSQTHAHKHKHTHTNTRTHTDSEPRTRVVASCKTSSGFNRAVHDITVNCSRQALIVKWEDANSTAVFFFFFKQLEVQQLRMFYRVYSRKRFPCLVLEKKKSQLHTSSCADDSCGCATWTLWQTLAVMWHHQWNDCFGFFFFI